MDFTYAVKKTEGFDPCRTPYYILSNGKSIYSEKTEADFLADGFSILDEDAFSKLWRQYEKSLCGHWKEITEEFYEYALNVLPPVGWYAGGFFSREAYSGSIHDYYQQIDGKYYSSLQCVFDPRAAIMEDLRRAIAAGTVEPIRKETIA